MYLVISQQRGQGFYKYKYGVQLINMGTRFLSLEKVFLSTIVY